MFKMLLPAQSPAEGHRGDCQQQQITHTSRFSPTGNGGGLSLTSCTKAGEGQPRSPSVAPSRTEAGRRLQGTAIAAVVKIHCHMSVLKIQSPALPAANMTDIISSSKRVSQRDTKVWLV